jgi:hypothetical protein
MYTWECKVNLNGIPTILTTNAASYLQAKGYFLTFGKLLSDPRIVKQ